MRDLSKRMREGNFRRPTNERAGIDFASNDYLGLSRSKELQRRIFEELAGLENVWGSTGSRLLTGNWRYAEALEEEIARFHGYPAGVLFSCGYMANVGLLSAVAADQDIILFDAQIHASTKDGIRLSRAQAYPFKHNDLDHLERRLKSCPAVGTRWICIDSVYSTDGSFAPLKEIVVLAQQFGARLIVDEAHAVGVLGPHGRGLVAEESLTEQVFAQVVPFGKGPGVHGAIVLGSRMLQEMLWNFANAWIYTTALPKSSLAAIRMSYQMFPSMDAERRALEGLIKNFKKSLSPIQPVIIPGCERVKRKSQELWEHGFDVRPLVSPTVQRGKESLQICLHAFNTQEELHKLMEYLNG